MLLLFGMTIIPATNANNIVIKEINIVLNINQPSDNEDFQTYKLLIIYQKIFSRELKLLGRHKEKYGISTYITTYDEVYKQMY